MSDLLPTTVYDLGYSKSLLKIDSFYDEPAILKEKTGNLLPPTLLSSGQLVENLNFGESDYNGSLRSGDIAWNKDTGVITGGTGVLIYRGGIIGASAGIVTFKLDAITGDATFSGTIISSEFRTSDNGPAIVINSVDQTDPVFGFIPGNTFNTYDVDDNHVIQIGGEDTGYINVTIFRSNAIGAQIITDSSVGTYNATLLTLIIDAATGSSSTSGISVFTDASAGYGALFVSQGSGAVPLVAGQNNLASFGKVAIFENNYDDTNDMILIDQRGRGTALKIDVSDTANALHGLHIDYDGTGKAFWAYKTGNGLMIDIEKAGTGSGNLMNIYNAGTGNTINVNQANGANSNSALLLNNAGSGRTLEVIQTTQGNANVTIYVENAGSAAALYVSRANQATSNNTVEFNNGQNGTGAVLYLGQSSNISTNFKKMIDLDGVRIWRSNGTTPNGNLTGTQGDICVNGPSGQTFYCGGGTTWTGM